MRVWIIFLACTILSACGVTKSNESNSSSSSSSETGTGATGGGGANPINFKLTCEEAQFTKLLNIYRVSQGRVALVVSKQGTLAGRWHAQDMAEKNYFDHTEPNGRTAFQRGFAFGATTFGENIAAGNSLASQTFCQLKASPVHNANMLNLDYRSIGMGRFAGGSYGTNWSNNFGPAISDSLPEPLNSDAGCVLPTSLPACS